MKPLLLLDIDGVVNAFDLAAPYTKGYEQVQANGYRLTFRPEWAEWVEGMSVRTEAVWATMWQAQAISHFAPATGIGVHIDGYIDFDRHHREGLGWRTGIGVGGYKQPGVEAFVGSRPFVWIDDDVQTEQVAWAIERTLGGVPTLLIKPDPAIGLTLEHVQLVEAFCEIVDRAEEALIHELAAEMDALL